MSRDAAERWRRLADAQVYLIVTAEAVGADGPPRVRAALESGAVDLVQARAKSGGAGKRAGLVAWLAALADEFDVPWILNDDPPGAVAFDADGAHVGDDDLDPHRARETLGAARLLGVSTHDGNEVLRAVIGPADHAGLGPCFPSDTKRLARPTLGPAGVAASLAAVPSSFPVFAIGGIDEDGAARLAEVGVARVAVGAGILDARDPARAAAAIRRRLAPLRR